VVAPVERAEQELVPGVVLEETGVRPEVKQGDQRVVRPEALGVQLEEREAERLKEELELDQEEPEALQEPEQPSQGW
jgi:hypothetical protein